MKLETLRKNNKNKILIGISFIFIILSIITLVTSRAKYIKTQSVTIVDNEVKFTPYDFKIMAMYKQKDDCSDPSSDACYTKMGDNERMPSTGYAINEDLSYCTTTVNGPKDNDARIYTNSKGEIVISNLAKEDKCYLYFEKMTTKKVQTSLGLLDVNVDSAHFTANSTKLNENGIYETEDDDGPSYYFRGNVENNYVRFGKMGSEATGDDIYWRIIRINGDGSIRMMFAGTSNTGEAPSKTDTSTNITVGGKNTFTYSPNGATGDNMYVGYQYKSGEVHGKYISEGNGEKSNVEIQLEQWFEENLLDEFESENTKIDKNAGFCADRTTYNYSTKEPDENAGTGKTRTYYGGYIRTVRTHEPSLSCNNEDLFTYTESNKGTKSLTYPIGLSTIDEQVYAGNHYNGSETKYYLYNNTDYWTMSPYYFNDEYAHVFRVSSFNNLRLNDVSLAIMLRPVLNLTSESLNLGSGASNDPYRVS